MATLDDFFGVARCCENCGGVLYEDLPHYCYHPPTDPQIEVAEEVELPDDSHTTKRCEYIHAFYPGRPCKLPDGHDGLHDI